MMNYQTYQQIRAYCYQDLQGYIDTPERNAVFEVSKKLAGGRDGIARIKHEQDAAHDLFRCLDLTPRESAAAVLLAIISNHRAITWQREPHPASGKEPAPPLEKNMADALAKQTLDAVKQYAARLPEREADALLAAYEAAPAATKMEAAPATSQNGNNNPASDTANLVYWRVILNSKIKEIDANRKANVRKIIKYLRELKDKRLPDEGTTDELFWIDDMGNKQCVDKKTVSNAASNARKLP